MYYLWINDFKQLKSEYKTCTKIENSLKEETFFCIFYSGELFKNCVVIPISILSGKSIVNEFSEVLTILCP